MRIQIKAVMFHPGWDGGPGDSKKYTIEACFKNGKLFVFEAGQPEHSMESTFKEWLVEPGGSNDHLLFFKLRADPRQCFFFEPTREQCQALIDFQIPQWSEGLIRYSKKRFQNKAVTTGTILGLAGLLTALFLLRGPIASSVVNLIPYAWEQKTGQMLFDQVKMFKPKENQKKLLAALNSLLEPLREAIPEPYNQFVVHIDESKQVNAFAFAGGQMVFNEGLLKKAQSAEEILGVAAHEMAHVHKRHVLRGMVQAVGLFAVVQALFGDITGIIGVLSDQGAFLANQGFSRELEIEADDRGWSYLNRARVDPRGMIAFFKRLKELEKEMMPGDIDISQVQKALEFVSTHPSTDERIARLQKLAQELEPVEYLDLQPKFLTLKDSL